MKRRHSLKHGLLLVLASLLGACVSAPQSVALRQLTAADSLTPVLLTTVPFFPQSAYQCGPAALATILVASDVATTPRQLEPLVYVPARKGSFQVEMLATTRSYGRLAYPIAPTLSAMFAEVRAGHPVLVLQNLGLAWYPRWHFAVVKGFDPERRKVLLNSGIHENYEVAMTTFERTWARADYWGMVALAPGSLPATAEPEAYFLALGALQESSPETAVGMAYELGLQKWPGDRNLLMGLGNLRYQEGNANEATIQYRKVIANDPHYAPAWNNLAQILFESGDLPQAQAHARQAVALGGPFNAAAIATLRMISDAP